VCRSERRLYALLDGDHQPTADERQFLARAAGLDEGQVRAVEEGIEAGSIPLGRRGDPTPFARCFDDILRRLAGLGISARQVSLRTADDSRGVAACSGGTLSVWRVGKQQPTLESLRRVLRALGSFTGSQGGPLVPPDELERLARLAGFTPQDLTATSHQVVAGITGRTTPKQLLDALRNSTDISLTQESAAELYSRRPDPDGSQITYPVIGTWEKESRQHPSPAQVRRLLEAYNDSLAERRLPPLTGYEIDRVMEVAARDHTRWEQLSHAEKLKQAGRKPSRERLSSSFGPEAGPGRSL
jgi:hypothetical protein